MLLIGTTALFTSCGDEPNYRIAYYLDINTKMDLGLGENQEDENITSSDPATSPITTAVKNMKVALREAYPEPTQQGNDSAVLAALGHIYNEFQRSYTGLTTINVCVVKLCRAHIDDDGIIHDNKVMAVYQFSLLPVN